MSVCGKCRGAWCAVVLAAMLLFGAPARADDPLVTGWKSRVNGWTFAPAHSAAGGAVLGFLAWADPGITVGDNVSVLWYERDQNDQWRVWGWKTGDFTSAVAFARAEVSYPALWADDPELVALLGPAGTEPTPTEMEQGFFVDDPNAPTFLAQLNPEVVVATITALGYQTAPTLSVIATNDLETALPVNCLTNQEVNTSIVLNRLTFEAETALFGDSTLELIDVGELCCWCPCSTYWTYGAWTFLGTVDVGTVRHCKYSCQAQKIRRCFGHSLLGCSGCNTSTVIETAMFYADIVAPLIGDCPFFHGTGTPTGDPPNIFTEPPSWW
jgi:hypothetical protein